MQQERLITNWGPIFYEQKQTQCGRKDPQHTEDHYFISKSKHSAAEKTYHKLGTTTWLAQTTKAQQERLATNWGPLFLLAKAGAAQQKRPTTSWGSLLDYQKQANKHSAAEKTYHKQGTIILLLKTTTAAEKPYHNLGTTILMAKTTIAQQKRLTTNWGPKFY